MRITLPLAIAQTLQWAAIFYLLPALLPVLERETDWSRSTTSAALTGALVVSSFSSPIMGRFIDGGHGKLFYSAGVVLSAVLLLLFSFTESTPLFLGIWLVMGLCMTMTLYEPCFAIVTRHLGANARPMITRITLVAGFAGTISFPVANSLATQFDWQTAVRFFASVSLFVVLPLALLGFSQLEKRKPISALFADVVEKPRENGRMIFWCLASAFTLGGITHGMVITHLLPLLAERGVASQMAIFAAALIGPMQVVGRLLLMTNERRLSIQTTAFICIGGLGLGVLLLTLAGASVALIFAAVSLHGATWGLVSITRPAITQQLLGQKGYGSTSGKLAAFHILGVAAAPTIGAGLWHLNGYMLMLGTGAALAFTGAGLLWMAIKQHSASAA